MQWIWIAPLTAYRTVAGTMWSSCSRSRSWIQVGKIVLVRPVDMSDFRAMAFDGKPRVAVNQRGIR